MPPLGVAWILLLGHVWEAAPATDRDAAACHAPPELRGDPQGVIASPPARWGHPTPGRCTWVILGGPEDVVTIRFDRFQLPCGAAALHVRAEPRPPQSLCGPRPPAPQRFRGGNVTLSYRRGRAAAEGFQLRYERGPPPSPPPAACNLSLDGFYGVFSPPGWPGGPPGPPARCRWALDPHDSRPLTVLFTALELGPGDALEVYAPPPAGPGAQPRLLRRLDAASNGCPLAVEAPSSRAWVAWRGRGGFNATYHVRGFCVPWRRPCGAGGGGGCYGPAERCDGVWHCPGGADEEGCPACPGGAGYPCRAGPGAPCYPPAERCNYQSLCPDGADERGCWRCQPGHWRCGDGRCVYEAWRCDGQPDCADASDEAACPRALPRKGVAAAAIGALVCGLLLVVALGCTCRLWAARRREYSLFAPLSRGDAQLVRQEAPPSYGQLLAQGLIPPLDDFPTDSPGQATLMGNLRSLLHLLRQEPPGGGRRARRPPRPLRRLLRRLRRWGLLPRSTPAARPPAAPQAQPPPDAAGQEEGGAAGGPDEAPPLPQKVPPPGLEPPTAPAPVAPQRVPRGVMATLHGYLFPSPEGLVDPPSLPPSPQGDDDVLLLPLAVSRPCPPPGDPEDDPLLT